MKDYLNKPVSCKVTILLCIAGIFAGLFVYDRFFIYPPAHYNAKLLESGIHTLQLHPYTGFHVIANYHHVGDMDEKQPYHDYDIQTGDLGFFGFELNNPYTRKPNEFRIVWTGGSGAQGFGARTNADMMYRIIPQMLNEKLKDCGVEVTLFNLAMGGTKSYQNFVALNRWGQRLEPDMIVSYSGRNDVIIPFGNMNDAYFPFTQVNALSLANTPNERGFPGLMNRLFPRIMQYTAIGTGLRTMFYYGDYYQQALEDYARITGRGIYKPGLKRDDKEVNSRFFKEVVAADYAAALKSMKRDFQGIPVAVAWQAVKEDERGMMGLSASLGENFYQEWFSSVQKELGGYMNDQWYFYNVDEFMRQHPEENTGTHQGNAGQKLISAYLADQLAPAIRKLKGCRP